tara:strand:- start:19699 stop:20631 length:933 start_codon:yes stop_codon:yes gene_type:complete
VNNFVYAADKNYNKQLFYSINSLLENTDTDINLYIIHKEPDSFLEYKVFLENKFNKFSINLYQFEFSNFNFPNLENKHVSEATYYRLFIDKIIPKGIKSYIYLDADIIAINNLDAQLNKITLNLINSDYVVACRTDFNKNNENEEYFKNLGMMSSKYFNAGVMFVDNKKWVEKKMGELILERLEEIKDKINYWDQDVLNSYIDGQYIELSEAFNYPLNLALPTPVKKIEKDTLLIHYQGNNKPWNIRGCFNLGASFYQNIALKTEGKYHLVKTVRRFDLFYLIRKTLELEFNNLSKKLNFYKESIKIIFL